MCTITSLVWRNTIDFGYLQNSSHYSAKFTYQFSSVQLLIRVRLFVTPWTAGRQASLFITNSRSLHKLMSIELVMPSNHLILCCPLLLPFQPFLASGCFPMSQFFVSGGKNTGISASASVLLMNIQDWSPLGWTGWISLLSKEFSRIFSKFKSINSLVLSFLYNFCELICRLLCHVICK